MFVIFIGSPDPVSGGKEILRNNQMKIRLVLLGILITSGITPAQEAGSDFDSFLEAYTTVWNTHDGEALSAFFTTDADLIMGNIPIIAGRAAIGKWWYTYFSRIDESRKGEFRLLSLREIVPDVRIVNISSRTYGTNMDGAELETRLARGTWIMVKSKDNWQIAAMRGFASEGEQRLSPGVDR